MAEKKRARTKLGKFVADDPSTPANEAWVEAKPKRKRSSKKVLPIKGSASYKAMVLRGEIKE